LKDGRFSLCRATTIGKKKGLENTWTIKRADDATKTNNGNLAGNTKISSFPNLARSILFFFPGGRNAVKTAFNHSPRLLSQTRGERGGGER
jgi:hypothetical protein